MPPTAIPNLTVRDFAPADEGAVKDLITAAFPSGREARLVHTLRHCGALVLEQVAIDENGRIVGHVAYSRVTPAAIGPGQAMQIACLAPVSVRPEMQHKGVGTTLTRVSLEKLKECGEQLVLVLGPPAYFPRFGFDAELAKQVRGPYAGGAFMALALSDDCLRNLPIEVAFATPFEDFE